MAHYGLVDSRGDVMNVVLWDGEAPWTPPGGTSAILNPSGTVGPGWTYSNGAFMAPPAPPASAAPPATCQLWQLQAILSSAQWNALQQAVSILSNPAVTAFMAHGTNVIPANSTTVLQLGEAIGLAGDEIAALVEQASQVSIP